MRQNSHKLIGVLFDLGLRAIQKQGIIPNEAKEHFQQAYKEGMLGVQIFMDHYKDVIQLKSKEKG
jgi:hypothetical protein